jgi:hypothetical protein
MRSPHPIKKILVEQDLTWLETCLESRRTKDKNNLVSLARIFGKEIDDGYIHKIIDSAYKNLDIPIDTRETLAERLLNICVAAKDSGIDIGDLESYAAPKIDSKPKNNISRGPRKNH